MEMLVLCDGDDDGSDDGTFTDDGVNSVFWLIRLFLSLCYLFFLMILKITYVKKY